MAISDLVRFHNQQSSSSLTQEADPKPPSLKRFEFIVKSMASNAIKGPGASNHHRQMMRIIEMIFDESVQELVDNDVSDELMSRWIYWFGKLVEWCATGSLDGMPDDVRELVESYLTEPGQNHIAIAAELGNEPGAACSR
jgi:hypothetical protein